MLPSPVKCFIRDDVTIPNKSLKWYWCYHPQLKCLLLMMLPSFLSTLFNICYVLANCAPHRPPLTLTSSPLWLHNSFKVPYNRKIVLASNQGCFDIFLNMSSSMIEKFLFLKYLIQNNMIPHFLSFIQQNSQKVKYFCSIWNDVYSTGIKYCNFIFVHTTDPVITASHKEGAWQPPTHISTLKAASRKQTSLYPIFPAFNQNCHNPNSTTTQLNLTRQKLGLTWKWL